MSIEIHCQGCGRSIRAPRDAAGKWAKCPACGRSLYIPTPSDEIEELPLAPEDTDLLRREAELEAERQKLERQIRRETGDEPSEARRPTAARPAQPAGGVSLQSAVVEYLRALSRSDLGGAEQYLPLLRQRQAEVLSLLDRLAADQMPPAPLAQVPPGVYHGFLKHLRSQLAG